MEITTYRASVEDALEAFLLHYLHHERGQKELQRLVERIDDVLKNLELAAPVHLAEVRADLSRSTSAFEQTADEAYKREFERTTTLTDDFKDALTAWLRSLYWRENQPEISFEVLALRDDDVCIKVAIDYLGPRVSKR